MTPTASVLPCLPEKNSRRINCSSSVRVFPAYGYIRGENGELAVREEEAVVVRRIFREYLCDKGTYVIARELTGEGCPTIRFGEKWTDGVVGKSF